MNYSPPPFCTDAFLAYDPSSLAVRLGAAGVIFVVSLLASSFPTLAKRLPRVEPPLVVFFIGKHFGTGVILSTAFVHLLQEGFESLTDPCLPGVWKKWTGLTVLLSFLIIFLVEYISTVYVEYLSVRETEVVQSRLVTEYEHQTSLRYRDDPDAETSPLERSQGNGFTDASRDGFAEEMPVAASSQYHARSMTRQPGSSFRWHHRHESPFSHTHKAGPRLSHRQSLASVFLPDLETDTVSRMPSTLEHEHGHVHEPAYGGHTHEGDFTRRSEVSRKTRIVGILVLQLGIMLHSVVIGLTLSVTAGSKFTSLLVAIVFHQIFEGLSLGIRIASLPASGRKTHPLPAILCILFAIAAPAGVLLGIWLLPSLPFTIKANWFLEILDDHKGDHMAQLSKGFMCAISAGMLIYAAAVEMLAGDFVMDPEMRSNGLGMQVLALGSLIIGVIAMAVLGWA